ncbi:ATP-binding protein [Rugamonas apoptosis]|uniref:ATP-binding protein n=1 Tax=Rugamonas apoptosis TaxID=2758570 RepID=A0A7W2INC6_9BURK|nr:ATP-binding protein [Rugamonas apoptosis]MBA5690559.1 ATP-binding protein [Rugamonas apoptosis]
MEHFSRPALAREMADRLQGKSLFGDGANGLFLAAPRRTGKSTFLLADLAPELERRGVVVVYTDLWADRRRDPATLIAEAIGEALKSQLGLVARAARKSGLENVNIAGWLKIDTTKIGTNHGATLTDALRALHEASGHPVALIVDEAQQALSSFDGETAMMALKSARDQMNRPGQTSLMLVMSGSDRDKLMRLVNTSAAPFYGSSIQTMPLLDVDFVDHVCDLISKECPALAPLDDAPLLAAFRLLNSCPQQFGAVLGEALNPTRCGGERFETRVLISAEQARASNERQLTAAYLALKPLEQTIVWRMLEYCERFRAYDADAVAFYRTVVGKPVTTNQVQTALEALRNLTPPMVWKSARGEYSIEDTAMHPWYLQRAGAQRWPPAATPAPAQFSGKDAPSPKR